MQKKKTVLITVVGCVQGVGFRPFVYRIALMHGIHGWVKNTTAGVVILGQAESLAIDLFINTIIHHHPPLAKIVSLTQESCDDAIHYDTFSILESTGGTHILVDVSRDTTVCADCLREMNDPFDRRYRHAFITCTNCGPRYTIIQKLPYDRHNTTMAQFVMCKECEKEYCDPLDRRFHAEPTSCPQCGPKLSILDNSGNEIRTDDPLLFTQNLLDQGNIIAIKGLGGFHLACRADSKESVSELRKRKSREEKPFAVMAKDLESAIKYCTLNSVESEVLQSIERPILIAARRTDTPLVIDQIAPGIGTVALMLPYTPLHELLFKDASFDVLVMTSANYSHEPLTKDTDEAVQRLRGIADAFLTHNRDIHMRIDDSLVQVVNNQPQLVRRARGYAPAMIPLTIDIDGIVGLGGIVKSTIAIGRKQSCYVSHYLGTAQTLDVIDNCSFVLNQMLDILAVKPRLFVSDLHPAGLTQTLADPLIDSITVQHHHSHAVACLAENQYEGQALAVVYDGLGLGTDGNLWGGEVFVTHLDTFERICHWSYLPIIGGDAATVNPGRISFAALLETEVEDSVCQWMSIQEKDSIRQIVSSGNTHTLKSSSMGRLFDAASALLDICRVQTYEAQAAIMLEHSIDPSEKGIYQLPILREGEIVQIDSRQLLLLLQKDKLSGINRATIAARFHNTVAEYTARMVKEMAQKYAIDTVCLSGGCFQNKRLSELLISLLEKEKIKVLVHKLLPPNDECVALGQVVIAAARKNSGY